MQHVHAIFTYLGTVIVRIRATFRAAVLGGKSDGIAAGATVDIDEPPSAPAAVAWASLEDVLGKHKVEASCIAAAPEPDGLSAKFASASTPALALLTIAPV